MRYSRTRTSRTLITLLGITILLGLVAYLHNVARSHAAQAQAEKPSRIAEANLAELPAPETPKSLAAQPKLVAEAPTSAPAAAPSTPAAATLQRQTYAGPVGDVLANARAKKEAGHLIEARGALNDVFVAGRLSADEAEAARQLLSEINQAVVFSTRRFDDDPAGGTYTVQKGERLEKIAANHNVTWQLLCRLNGLSDPKRLRAGAAIKVINGPFHAVVSKSKFNMDIYLGSPAEANALYVTSFPVGIGKDDSTPAGAWQVGGSGGKIIKPVYYSPRGEGVIAADDPKNPLGGYWIGLTGVDGAALGKTSYGIHGTIEPDSIGKEASMGCIRLRLDDITLLYEMLVEGKSKVVVKD